MRPITLILLAAIGCADAGKSPVETTNKTAQPGESSLFGDMLGSTAPVPNKAGTPIVNNVPIPGANSQPPVDPNANPANNVLKFEAPKGNPYKVTPPANPPSNQKPTLVHYQQLIQANPNVKIVQKPVAGNILTFTQNQFATLGLKKSVDFYKAEYGNPPPYAEFQKMVQLNKTEFPLLQANQSYAYCSQSGAVFVVQK